MITIDQLLESVDLDFEPRWVTKDPSGAIAIWAEKPERTAKHRVWIGQTDFVVLHLIKLAEFENKDWQECIYEVPRKTDEYEQNLEKLRPADSDLVYRVNLTRKDKPVVKIEKLNLLNDSALLWGKKINELVAAVNELKGAKNE